MDASLDFVTHSLYSYVVPITCLQQPTTSYYFANDKYKYHVYNKETAYQLGKISGPKIMNI